MMITHRPIHHALMAFIGLVLCCFLCGSLIASAQVASSPAPITLDAQGESDIDVGLHAVFFVEDDRQLTLIEAINSGKWVPVNLALIDGSQASPDEASTAPYAIGVPTWVHFKLHNDSPKQRQFILDTQRPDLRQLDLFQQGEDGQAKKILEHSGFDPFDRRKIKQNDLASEISLQPNETVDFYMRYIRTASEPMPLKIQSLNIYNDKIRHKAILMAAFFSLLATIIVITALGLPALGWRIGLSYIFYVAMVGFWYAGVTGHFFSILTPQYPGFGNRAVEAFAVLVFVAFLNMGRVLFNYQEKHPIYYKLLVGVIIINILVAGFTFVVDIYANSLLAHIVSILTLISCILYVSNAVIAVKDKRSGAIVMLIGSLSLLMAFAIYRYVTVAVNAGEIVAPIGRLILVPPIAIIEICCFALAMIQGQIAIRRQRDKALRSEFEIMQEKLRLSDALHASETSFQKAQRQADIRQQRLSSVSHDILQPLTSLKASLKEVEATNPNKAENMREAFNYLESLARESLTQDSKASEKFESFKIRVVTDNVFAMFKDEARKKGIEFKYTPSDNFEVTTHPVELMRIVSNLISNAIKYTDKGSVELITSDDENTPRVIVKDTGRGMSPTEIDTFAKPYEKGETSQGSGLGLHQATTTSEALGYKFGIESEPHIGTTISIRFT